MEKRIYLDHAATTPLDREVLEKMLPYFTDHFGNADSPHAIGRKAMGAVDHARDLVAETIGARANEVYFTSGGTEADNFAILGGARAKRAEGRLGVILSAVEHHAALFAAETLRKEGFCVEFLPVNGEGKVSADELASLVNENTALVAVMTANNETGALQPVKECARIAHEKGALFFTDAVQAAPYMPIDVKEWDVDMLSFSAHKFYGPKGVGALYIKNGVKVEKLVGGGEQERGLRGGTVNVPSVVGLAEALRKNTQEMETANGKIAALVRSFKEKISVLDGVTQNGASGLPSVLNLRFSGVENASFLYRMDLQGVALAAGSACASASVKPSHVLTAMGLSEREARESVRFSFGKYNTEEEIVRAAELTVRTVRELRSF